MDILWKSLADIWRTLFVPAWDWFTSLDWPIVLAAIVLNLAIWLVRKPLAEVLIKITAAIANGIGVSANDTVKEGVRPAVRAIIMAAGIYAAIKIIGPPQVVTDLLEKVVRSVLVAAVFASIYAFCDPLAQKFEHYRGSDFSIQLDWVVRGLRVVTVFVGVAVVLGIWGIDVGPILTGMGVFGAAIALAAQDILKNLLAGITSMGEKRFRIGEWIKVEGLVEGTVEEIDFRSTLIRRFDLAPVYVPNAQLANLALTNFSRMSHRRIYWKIGIVHSATPAQLDAIRSGIDTYLAECGDFTEPDVARRIVRIDSVSEDAVEILVYCFTKSADYLGFQDAKERLVIALREIVSESGTQFAYPSRSIYVDALPIGEPFDRKEKDQD
ncbi:MAG: mechanosensitive ion channel family protein [Hyphomicrobiales bacterium]